MYNGQELKYLKEIIEMEDKCRELLIKTDEQRAECLSILCSLEEKRNELEEYVNERAE